jgi:hypothetical protein
MERPERANTLPVLLIRPVIRTDVSYVRRGSGTEPSPRTGCSHWLLARCSVLKVRARRARRRERPPDTADGRPASAGAYR